MSAPPPEVRIDRGARRPSCLVTAFQVFAPIVSAALRPAAISSGTGS
jgi:hypothetical protein